MPYKTEWVPADLFMVHNGVKVYHAYEDGEYNNVLSHCYQLSDGSDDQFDIRDLRTYTPELSHELIIRAAIEAGQIKSID